MFEKILTKYNEAVFDTDREKALKIIDDALAKGVTPEDIMFKVIILALESMIKTISEDFFRALDYLVESFGNKQDIKLKDIHLLSQDQTGYLLNDLNDTQTDFSDADLIHKLFEQQVATAPDKTALITDSKKFSYQQLNEKANQLAHQLNPA